MNNGRIYDIVLTILKKEGRGNIVKPDRFTYLLQQCHLEYYNQQFDKWAGSQTIHDSLRPFLVLDEAVTITTGEESIADLAHTYKHAVAARTSSNVSIDIQTPLEWNEYAGDAVMAPTATYPALTIDNDTLYVAPDTITDIKLSYLREATNDPYFDYYLDSSYNVKYLDPADGATYTLQSGEVYRDGQTSGTVDVESVELEWGDQDKVNIISILLEKLGLSIQAPDIAQYAMGKQQQQNIV